MDNDPGDDDTDPLDQFEQAYRAATSDKPEPADVDARIAALDDDTTPPGRRRRRTARAQEDRLPTGDVGADLGSVLDALARLEARLDRLEASLTQGSSVGLIRTSHQSLGRKLDGHAEDLLAALDRIERRLDEQDEE